MRGSGAAGGVIQSFGEFVAGDRIEVGVIIFVIIVLIQFIVITKGATRISEVAARFALDGMPGRQMAIDADLNAGLIDEKQAQSRREEISAQADFYGAMDGASKFVRGDAIAGIVITIVNVIGGLYIGVMQSGMTFTEAGALFTKLTIGDGLVSQVRATDLAGRRIVGNPKYKEDKSSGAILGPVVGQSQSAYRCWCVLDVDDRHKTAGRSNGDARFWMHRVGRCHEPTINA